MAKELSARDQLGELINDSRDEAAGWHTWNFGHAADAILAAGWRPPLPAGEADKVADFCTERARFITAINNCHPDNDRDYWRWQGHAEARRQLSERLGLPTAWPAGYPKDGA